MKIIFMGTPDFAKESLEAVYNSKNEILAVVTNPDKPKGRGMKMIASPVKEFALEKNLKIYQPTKVRNNTKFIEEIKSLNPDLLCVVAYGKILPKELLDIPKYGAINVHGSLLPKYRGAAPIQWAVLNGDKKTGITTMFMDVGMDTGDMILKEETEIGEDETTGELWDRLSKMGAKLLVKTIEKIEKAKEQIEKEESTNKQRKNVKNDNSNNLNAENVAQENNCCEANSEILEEVKKSVGAEKQGENFTLAPMLDKEMAKINWNNSSREIKNLVRGLNPIMGAYSFLNGKKIKFWKVETVSIEELAKVFPEIKEYEGRMKKLEVGTIAFADNKKGIFIKTGDSFIKVLELQGENAKKMDYKSFLNGNKLQAGEIFE